MNEIFRMSEGNPGAITFLMEFTKPENLVLGLEVLPKLKEMRSIKGTNLYVLWSDLCGKDLQCVKTLVNNCPKEILEDACSRQDYSGRELVKEYIS